MLPTDPASWGTTDQQQSPWVPRPLLSMQSSAASRPKRRSSSTASAPNLKLLLELHLQSLGCEQSRRWACRCWSARASPCRSYRASSSSSTRPESASPATAGQGTSGRNAARVVHIVPLQGYGGGREGTVVAVPPNSKEERDQWVKEATRKAHHDPRAGRDRGTDRRPGFLRLCPAVGASPLKLAKKALSKATTALDTANQANSAAKGGSVNRRPGAEQGQRDRARPARVRAETILLSIERVHNRP